MKHPAPLLIALAALCCCPVSYSQAPVAQDSVVARDLKKLRVPGKVAAVLWTRRNDRFTLQVVPPGGSRIGYVAKPDPKAQSFADRIQVWLLRADGTMIMPAGFATPGANPGKNLPPVEVLYAFPLSANKEAVAVAMKVDDQFYIEELESFSN